MRKCFAWLFVALLAWHALAATPTLDEVKQHLTLPNRVFGGGVAAGELGGRMVIFWDLTGYVAPLSTLDEDASSTAGNETIELMRKEMRALRSAAKGALKDGRVLLIGVMAAANDPEARKRNVQAVRRLRPPCTVYCVPEPVTALFNAQSKHLVSASLKDIAEGSILTEALKETPDYLPGRILLFRTPEHESMSKNFVEGKNIEKPLATLRREAGGQGPKAEEARKMVEGVEAWAETQCATIENLLQSAPSQALEVILIFNKTLPSRARRYLGAANGLQRNQGIKLLHQAHAFLEQVEMGRVGRNDMINAAESFTEKLTELSQAKGGNPALAAEAQTLIAQLAPLTAAAQAQVAQNAKAARMERRRLTAEAEKASRSAKKEAKEREQDKPERFTMLDVIKEEHAPQAAALDLLRDELGEFCDACNYEVLRAKLAKIAEQKSPKAEGAKVAVAYLDNHRKQVEEKIASTLKEQTFIDVQMRAEAWRRALLVNYPSLGSAKSGWMILKVEGDSELRAVAENIRDFQEGQIDTKGITSIAAYRVAEVQYKQARLRTIQKYRKNTKGLLRQAFKNLDTLGFSEEAINKQLGELDTQLKEAKRALKDAEKERKALERQNRD
ncbi:MAG: hypothetical protein ACI4QJ_07735 [Candidatus Spyradenecus sp.]